VKIWRRVWTSKKGERGEREERERREKDSTVPTGNFIHTEARVTRVSGNKCSDSDICFLNLII
jgi:hypothetical protein